MNKMRYFALGITLTMCLGLLPTGAAATEGEDVKDQAVEVVEDGVQGVVDDTEVVVDGTEGVVDGAEVVVDDTEGEAEVYDLKDEGEAVVAEEAKTLQEQITAANGATTISLTANATESITIGSGKDITLSIAPGVTLTNEAGKHTISVEKGGKLTVTGSGKVDNVSNGRAAVYNAPGGTVTLSGGTFTRSKEASTSASDGGGNSFYTLKNFGTMTVNDGVTVNQGADGAGKYSSLVANGWQSGSTAGQPGKEPAYEADASLTIAGGTFNGGLNTIKNDDYGQLTINGGEFKNVAQAAVLNWNVANITKGTFISDKNCILNGGGNATLNRGELTIAGGTFTCGSGSSVLAAMNGNSAYLNADKIKISGGTFSDMSFMPFATEGASVKLSGSNISSENRITVKKSLTLDLGGNTLTSSADYAFLVSPGKSFTLKNGTLKTTNSSGAGIFGFKSSAITVEKDATLETTGGGILATNNSADEGHATINVYGTIKSQDIGVWCQGPKNTVNLDGAAITSKYFGIYQNGSYGGGTFTIKNSTITDSTEDGAGVYISNSKTNADDSAQGMQTLTIENSKISGATGVEVKFTNVTIRGDQTDITGSGTPAATSPNSNGSTTTGYAFALTNNATDNKPDASKGTVTIQGGSFTGEIGIQKAANETNPDASISITGGTFSIDPSKVTVGEETVSFVASGYRVTESEGKWTVSRVPSSSSGSSSPATTTTTQENEDGSVTTTVTNNRTGAVTETTERPDGSSTTVETQKDGTVTTTETAADGSTATTVEKPDGSSQTNIEQADGTTATVTTDAEGATQAQVELSDQAMAAAQDSGEAVTLPIPALEAAQDTASAPTVEITLPKGAEAVDVEVPVADVTPGTVAVLVHPDGTEEIVRTSLPTEDGVALTLDGSATVKIVDNAQPFDDLEGEHWAKDSVDFVSARELFRGTAERTFAPEEPMTRAMLLTVLARVEDVEPADDETWYGGALDWAVETGISDGSSLNAAITREQLATMLYRAFGRPGTAGDLSAFTDADRLSPFAADAMSWAVEAGLIKGLGNGILDPQGQATRAQVAAIMERYLKLK